MYVISHNSLLLEKILTLHNVIIHIKSIFNDDKNNCYYNVFLEKCSYQLPKNNNKLQMPYCNRIAVSERVELKKGIKIVLYLSLNGPTFNCMSALDVMIY